MLAYSKGLPISSHRFTNDLIRGSKYFASEGKLLNLPSIFSSYFSKRSQSKVADHSGTTNSNKVFTLINNFCLNTLQVDAEFPF